MAPLRQTLDGRSGGPLTHSSYTTRRDTTRLQGEIAGERAAQEAELERVRRQSARLIDAIADGTPPAMVNDRLRELDARRVKLEEQIATGAKPAPGLHPNLAQLYRQKVANLTEVLAREDAAEVRELIRGLVAAIVLVPEDGALRVELCGELASILALAEGARRDKGAGVTGALAEQIEMVAGTRFNLSRTRFRLA